VAKRSAKPKATSGKPRKAKAKKRGPKKHLTLIQRSRSKRPSEKATYHQVLGAGRSRVKRPFFGLSDSDKAAITDRVAEFLDKALKDV